MIVVHSFVVWIVRIHRIYTLELYVMEKKRKKKEEKTNLKLSHLIFLTVRRRNGTLGLYFTDFHIRIAKGFHY